MQVQIKIEAAFANTPLAPVGSAPYEAMVAVGNNLFSFDTYIPFLFIMMNLIALILAGVLNSSPLGWVVGFITMFAFVFVAIYVSNISHTIFTSNSLISGAAYFETPLKIIATLPMWSIGFLALYLVIISVRSIFFKPQQQNSLGGY